MTPSNTSEIKLKNIVPNAPKKKKTNRCQINKMGVSCSEKQSLSIGQCKWSNYKFCLAYFYRIRF